MLRSSLAWAALALLVSVVSAVKTTAQTGPSANKARTAGATVSQRLSQDGILLSRYFTDRYRASKGVLTVSDFSINYSEESPRLQRLLPNASGKVKASSEPVILDLSCSNVDKIDVKPYKSASEFWMLGFWFQSGESGLTVAGIYQGIKDACQAQRADHERQLAEEARVQAQQQAQQRAKDEELAAEYSKKVEAEVAAQAKQRQIDEAVIEATFHDQVLAAIRAAEETDPFSSVRGEFDLSAPDNRHWRTTLELSDAAKCGLLKIPVSSSPSATMWAFSCTFWFGGLSAQAAYAQAGYANLVKSVQAVVGVPYQPDEGTTDFNQVFFASPSRPTWRIYVAKIDDRTVGFSVLGLGPAGAEVASPGAQVFLDVPIQKPAVPSISQELDQIRRNRNSPLPPLESAPTVSSGNGMSALELRNQTGYTLTALFSGPTERRIEIGPGGSSSVELQPGTYAVAARVNSPNVIPMYGDRVIQAGGWRETFYLEPVGR